MNKSAEFNFSYEVMMYVNVLYTDIKFRIFSQNYNFLIIYLNYNYSKSL